MRTVLDTALAELVAHGLDGFNVERIARAAQVNKTSIYRRWPSKGALVAAALERTMTDISLRLDDSGSLRGDLAHLCAEVAALLSQPLGRELARAALGEDSEVGALASRQLSSQAQGPQRDLTARAIARGEWRDTVAAEIVLSLLVGALIHRLLLEKQPLTPAWQQAMIDAVLLGVMPRG